jgi:hypothetical protein
MPEPLAKKLLANYEDTHSTIQLFHSEEQSRRLRGEPALECSVTEVDGQTHGEVIMD